MSLADLAPDVIVAVDVRATLAHVRLFDVLEELMSLRFADAGAAVRPARRLAGLIRCDGERQRPVAVADTALPSLTMAVDLPADRQPERIEVCFGDVADVPMPFRGRTVTTEALVGRRLEPRGSEQVLASDALGALWTVSDVGGVKHFRSAMPLVGPEADAGFSQVFGGDRFLENLPLMQFLRSTVLGDADRSAPLRAAFMFDDPNLHWPRYGFIDFLEVARRAKQRNYHVSFATIPLDAWFCHTGTAAIFRRHADELSLLVHGNNHLKHELARAGTEAARQGLLSQALRRIESLESKSSLPVCRVMVPPHGACSEQMLQALPARGFESACISAGSLRAHNPLSAWVRRLGHDPAETISGCPVLPRWSFAGNVRNAVLVAAYLGRPIVLRGHHEDVRDGLDVLDEHAQFINGLGTVQWRPLSALARMSYRHRTVGSRVHVTPFARRVRLELPASATELVVDGSAGSRWTARMAGVEVPMGERRAISLPAEGPRVVELQLKESAAPPLPAPAAPRGGLTPWLRRALTECRDRSKPWLAT